MVHFPTLKGLDHEKKPVMYVVQQGRGPVLPADRGQRTGSWTIRASTSAAKPTPTSAGELSAYLFSDRGIYRPGDLFHIGLIVRTASWAQSPAGVPLQAEIVDPRGDDRASSCRITVDASGFAELDYTPAETAPTGTWTVNLYIVGKKAMTETAIGSTTVSVKEFLPDSMKVDAKLSAHVADGWVKPDAAQGRWSMSHNLFGTPAANRRVEATLTLTSGLPGVPATGRTTSSTTCATPRTATRRKLAGRPDRRQGPCRVRSRPEEICRRHLSPGLSSPRPMKPEGGRSVAASGANAGVEQ